MSFTRCAGSMGYSWNDSHQAERGAKDDLCIACRQAVQRAEANAPVDKRVWQLFAMERKEGFAHFYPSTMQLKMCGNDPMAFVQLTVDPEGSHWGWYHSHHPHNRGSRGQVSMIYPSLVQVRICFTYGPEAETARGRGDIVRLRVEKLRAAVHPEGILYDDNA
jgi:hypothetical protein